MNRKGSISIIMLLFFFISLIMGAFSGIYKALNRENKPAEIAPPGYSTREEGQEMKAVPIPETALPGKKAQKTRKKKTYLIKGMGKKGTVIVDIPEEEVISIDINKAEKGPSIELPPELEEIASKAKEQIDAFDEATKKTIQSVMESLNIKDATPDKATIRPSGGGFQLNVSIPVGED